MAWPYVRPSAAPLRAPAAIPGIPPLKDPAVAPASADAATDSGTTSSMIGRTCERDPRTADVIPSIAPAGLSDKASHMPSQLLVSIASLILFWSMEISSGILAAAINASFLASSGSCGLAF